KDKNGDPFDVRDTSLVKLSGRGVGLAGRRIPKTEDDRRWGTPLLFWRSSDAGETGGPPVGIASPGLAGYPLQDVLLRTSSGRIIYPVYNFMGKSTGIDDRPAPFFGKLVNGQWVPTSAHFLDTSFYTTVVFYSDDDGLTWHRNKDGDLIILLDWGVYSYCGEPSVAEVAPGHLLMMMRTGLGRLYQAWSHDNGETWTRPQPTALAATQTPAQIRQLPNGHLLIVWNQESEEDVKRGFNRMRISAAISR